MKLQQRLGTTLIYVTHDQVEAMTMGTRIVVMKDGVTQQIDTPVELFNHPKNLFVAGFIGTPQMNFFDASLICDSKKAKLTFVDGQTLSLDLNKLPSLHDQYKDGLTHAIKVGVRAEHLKVAKNGIVMKVTMSEILGSTTQVYANLEGADKDTIISILGNTTLKVNDDVVINFDEEHVHMFDAESEETILG